MDIENLYHQARQVAAAEGLTNEDVALQIAGELDLDEKEIEWLKK